MIGPPGYIRGAVSRGEPSFSDFQMQHLLPPNDRPGPPQILASDLMCKSTQSSQNYSQNFPRLEAHPGDHVALQYQENGHVTLLPNTPQKKTSGMIYIYGTERPRHDEKFLDVHKTWNGGSEGLNNRGKLLKTWSFDDGQCYQVNQGKVSLLRQERHPKAFVEPQGSDLWCQIDVRIPLTSRGTLTIYWVWDFSTPPSPDIPNGKAEFYTSCLDIKLAGEPRNYNVSFVKGQDINFAGIETQLVGGF
ncbi:hypothetical protein FALBO_17111 [Fusarium albosuccineum]|uniref:DUF7492 domain-containing protein n=1 Tax=Fusarium albosuccineum TaxID=1237068 RepID=A0A8H4K9X1_9HYPO|nr:hypothetical protein FALBO_17111 [Fusarium albosuccineum]